MKSGSFKSWIWVSLLLCACVKQWVPTGGVQITATGGQCDSFSLEKKLESLGSKSAEKTEFLRAYFAQCDGRFDGASKTSGIFQLLTDLSATYKIQSHRQYEKRWVKLSTGRIMPAHILLKTGVKKYPLLIFQCGAQCDSQTPSFSFFATTFFDEGPFHVLLLPSSTSNEWQSLNQSVSIGGYEEGLRVLELAKWIRLQSSFRARVSSVHLLGTSLGGQTALYAALYSGYLKLPDGREILDSTMAGCPVVDLKSSITDVLQTDFIGAYFLSYFSQQVKNFHVQFSFLNPLPQNFLQEGPRSHAAQYLAAATMRSNKLQRESPEFKPSFDMSRLPEGLRQQGYIDDADFWRKNEFLHYAHLLKSKIFVWASKDDLVVPRTQNGFFFDNNIRTSDLNSNVEILFTQKGNHCSWATSFGHRVAGAVLRDYFVTASPELRSRKKNLGFQIRLGKLSRTVKIFDSKRRNHPFKQWFEWKVASGDGRGFLHQHVVTPCGHSNAAFQHYRCERVRKGAVLLNNLGLQIPSTPIEAEALTRFLNVHAKIDKMKKTSVSNSKGTSIWVQLSRYE